MPAVIGSRSRAPRVLSERVGGAPGRDRYTVSLEGIAGQHYAFRVRAPDEATARTLTVQVGGGATAVLTPATPSGRERTVEVTFPRTGGNADGYTAATLVLERSIRP
jgi:hypothetical protein